MFQMSKSNMEESNFDLESKFIITQFNLILVYTGRCLKPEQLWRFFDDIFIICEQL